ncbi:3'-5' exonuclease, partial [Candidatus Peregrinibacteria bacterium]|nr:3'-5' exonuclease [Candidatus Peregrinibacteria bacterium]
MPFIVLDTETTGLFPRVHKIVELAFVRVENGKVTDQYEQLYDSDDDIPSHVQVLTRIRPEDLQGQPKLEEHVKKIQSLIGSDTLLLGQNLGFDLDMLRAEGLDLRDYPWIDTSMLASLVFPELASYSLGYMSTVLGLRHDPVHRALGDVRATLELFERIWERIEKLPVKHLTVLRETFARSTTGGYQRLAECLPQTSNAQDIPWSIPARENIGHDAKPFPIPPVTSGTVLLLEDSLDPHALHHFMNAICKQKKSTTWIAVKNIEATLRRMQLPKDVRVLHPPFLLLDPEAATRLQEQSTFTADEATLAVKLHWFPARVREDLPIHGGERDVWNGKLACTDISPLYTSQFENLPTVILLDHRQLLHFLADREHRALSALRPDHLVVIDDASMLEDTATKAYGHHITVSDLRAAAVGHAVLAKFIDLLELWVEKVRGNDDVHLLSTRDLTRKETKGLREQLAGHIGDASLPHRTQEHLCSLATILSENIGTRLTWIECRQHKTTLHAAPENTAELLHQNLFSRFPTVLLSPPSFTSIPETTQGNPAVHP